MGRSIILLRQDNIKQQDLLQTIDDKAIYELKLNLSGKRSAQCTHTLIRSKACLCGTIRCQDIFVTFPFGILSQVWCLIVSIPGLCPFYYFKKMTGFSW